MIEETKYTEQEWHRKMAIDLFNLTWRLLEKPDRTIQEDDHMIHAAHSSRYHWGEVSAPANFARGEWQIAHVYTSLNQSQPALYHAQRCLTICETNGALQILILLMLMKVSLVRWPARATQSLQSIAAWRMKPGTASRIASSF